MTSLSWMWRSDNRDAEASTKSRIARSSLFSLALTAPITFLDVYVFLHQFAYYYILVLIAH